jgi:hypothetical protein
MPESIPDLDCRLGATVYRFRAPDVYDPARARRYLTRQRVRRPSLLEFRVVALAGVAKLAETVGDPDEGARQQAIIEEWYELVESTKEDDIDEPDLELRAAEFARREAARISRQGELQAEAMMIEATLERHWSPYAELLADRHFWDEVARIDIVRLLLDTIDGRAQRRDAEGLLTQDAYRAIQDEHRAPLATFAFRLMAPDEETRKN